MFVDDPALPPFAYIGAVLTYLLPFACSLYRFSCAPQIITGSCTFSPPSALRSVLTSLPLACFPSRRCLGSLDGWYGTFWVEMGERIVYMRTRGAVAGAAEIRFCFNLQSLFVRKQDRVGP